MDDGLSVAARAEISAKCTRAFQSASKRDKVRLLAEIVAVTGWSRDNIRRRLRESAKPRAVKSKKRQRARKYSYDPLRDAAAGVCAFGRGVRQNT